MSEHGGRSDGFVDPFEAVVLKNKHAPALEVHVLPFGLTMHRMLLFSSASAGASSSSTAIEAGPAATADLLAGPEAPRDHFAKGRSFFGPLVGRFANRLPSGLSKYTDAKTGKEVQINLSEWGGDGVCHHGGPVPKESPEDLAEVRIGEVPPQRGPFDRLVWTPLIGQARHGSQLFHATSGEDGEDGSSALFAVHSAQDDNGFPGELRVEAKVSLAAPSSSNASSLPFNKVGQSVGRVKVEYRAKLINASGSEASECVTPLNLTHHWGFNLSASSDRPQALAEQGRVDEHTLLIQVPSSAGSSSTAKSRKLVRLELDDKGIATGGLIDCATAADAEGHGWSPAAGKTAQSNHAGDRDLALGRRIIDSMPEGGYDHFYVFGSPDSTSTSASPGTALASSPIVAVLHSASAGVGLAFRTNQSGVQLYTANGQPAHPADPASSGGSMKTLHDPALRRQRQQHQYEGATAARSSHGNATRSAAFLEFGHPHATFLRPQLQEYLGGNVDTLLRSGEVYDNWCEVEVFDDQSAK